jgi:hypothetical protein
MFSHFIISNVVPVKKKQGLAYDERWKIEQHQANKTMMVLMHLL